MASVIGEFCFDEVFVRLMEAVEDMNANCAEDRMDVLMRFCRDSISGVKARVGTEKFTVQAQWMNKKAVL